MSELMDRGVNTIRGGIGGALKGALIGLGATLLFGALVGGLALGFGVPLLGALALGGLASGVSGAFLTLTGAKFGGGIGAVVGGLRSPVNQQMQGAGMSQDLSVNPQVGQGQVQGQVQGQSYTNVANAAEMGYSPEQQSYVPQQGQGRGQPVPPQDQYYPPQVQGGHAGRFAPRGGSHQDRAAGRQPPQQYVR